jgi:hypothetical protein
MGPVLNKKWLKLCSTQWAGSNQKRLESTVASSSVTLQVTVNKTLWSGSLIITCHAESIYHRTMICRRTSGNNRISRFVFLIYLTASLHYTGRVASNGVGRAGRKEAFLCFSTVWLGQTNFRVIDEIRARYLTNTRYNWLPLYHDLW